LRTRGRLVSMQEGCVVGGVSALGGVLADVLCVRGRGCAHAPSPRQLRARAVVHASAVTCCCQWLLPLAHTSLTHPPKQHTALPPCPLPIPAPVHTHKPNSRPPEAATSAMMMTAGVVLPS
jgi:hypothetical protein